MCFLIPFEEKEGSEAQEVSKKSFDFFEKAVTAYCNGFFVFHLLSNTCKNRIDFERFISFSIVSIFVN